MNARQRELTYKVLYVAVSTLATVQFVWFYLSRVRSCLDLVAYEQGRERTPFQYRLLLMLPLRWAHDSPHLQAMAARLTAMPGWFPGGVRPEGLFEAAIDVVSIAVAGWMATRLYRQSSRHGLLARSVYPLCLIMSTWTYCILTMHSLRFVYDLPSLAFFAIGMVMIYEQTHPLYFCVLFLVATINRETTLLLLLLFAMSQCCRGEKLVMNQLWIPRSLLVLIPLSACWVSWHIYVVHHFSGNPADSKARFWLNAGTLMWPLSWPQVAGACCYLWVFVFLMRDRLRDRLMKAWLWLLPAWLLFMMYYGILVEARIFGELIPYVAVASVLICEQALVDHLRPVADAGG